MRNKNLIQQSATLALRSDERVAATYLFGSFVHGRMTPESDLDVAILFRKGAVPAAMALVELGQQLSSTTGLDVDIVCLNTAGPIVAMQVIRKGIKIVDRDPRETMEFFVGTIERYDDLKTVRRPIERAILNGRMYG